jgi:mono/diheme cytochrome c family protein
MLNTLVCLLCRAGIRRWLLLVALCAASAASATDLHAYWDDRCQSCHGDSGPFARSTLALRDGRLVGRHHVDDLPRFLHQHYLADALVAPVIAMLTAQVATPPLYAAKCAGCHGVASAFAREALVLRDGRLFARGRDRPVADLLGRHGGLAPDEQLAMLATLLRVRREVGD